IAKPDAGHAAAEARGKLARALAQHRARVPLEPVAHAPAVVLGSTGHQQRVALAAYRAAVVGKMADREQLTANGNDRAVLEAHRRGQGREWLSKPAALAVGKAQRLGKPDPPRYDQFGVGTHRVDAQADPPGARAAPYGERDLPAVDIERNRVR